MATHRTLKTPRRQPSIAPLAIVVAAIATIGVVLLAASRAATPYSSATAAKGTLSGAAVVQSGGGAASGSYVQFGSVSSSGSTSGSGYFPQSRFDQPTVQQMTVSSSSAQYVNDFVTDYQTHYGAVAVNQMPIFTVPASQPLVPISVSPGCGNFTPSTGTSVPIPTNAYTTSPSYQNDSAVVIYQPSTNSDWELWQAAKNSSGNWSACWGGKLNPSTSDGVFPNGYGLSGSGISYLALTITEQDIQSGVIKHAIALDLPACSSPPSYPADRTDCSSDPGQPPEGTWWRFPANLSMPSGLTPFGQMVFKAIQTYGMVQTDQSGSVALQAESTADWATSGHTGTDPITASWNGEAEYQVVANLPWSSLQALNPPAP